MPRLFNLGLLLSATIFAVPAWSQIYKWVDENGVVNYTSQPPANGKAEELDLDSTRFSVIETDKPERLAAMAANSEISSLKIRLNQLESELDAERNSRRYAAESIAPAPVADQYAYPGYLYAPATVVIIRQHFRKPHIIPTKFIPTPVGTPNRMRTMPMNSFHGMRFTN